MLNVIWMSDPHFTKEEDVLGHDPRARVHAAIDHSNANYSHASYCIISGDMVNRGTIDNYHALNRKLVNLKIPFLPMVGNHDDRSIFRTVLPLPDSCMKEFIQYSVLVSGCLILCLDTQKAGSDAGEFCIERSTWLRNALENAGDAHVYIFMHHPPMELGLPMQDSENMENGSEFLELISEYSCVKYLFIGHIHRPITGTVRGVPFATMSSILYQAPAPKPEWSWETFNPAEEAPKFGLISITESMVRLQYIEFCKYNNGIE